MQPSSIEIEQIVRVVMQRLAAAGDLISGVGSIADTELSELVLRQRVITLASLEGQTLKGKQRLRVHPRAVVTPAVHDELRKFKVELVRDAASPTKAATAASSTLKSDVIAKPGLVAKTTAGLSSATAPILVCGSALWFGSLSRHLCPKQAMVQPCDDAAAIGLLKQHKARGGARAVWLTSTPFAASVAVAQAACCRAVLLPGLSELRAALDQANPECLIIDASRTTVAAIGNIVKIVARFSKPT